MNRKSGMNHFLIPLPTTENLSHFEMQFISMIHSRNRLLQNVTIFLSSLENIATISNLINSISRLVVIISIIILRIFNAVRHCRFIDRQIHSMPYHSNGDDCTFVLIQINDGQWIERTNSKSIVLSPISSFIFNNSTSTK